MRTNTTDELVETYIDDKEDDLSRDVTDGGLLGALGGGIVGGLAGGPVGAVIGAVVGAGASAAAVDLIEHHTHAVSPEDLSESPLKTTAEFELLIHESAPNVLVAAFEPIDEPKRDVTDPENEIRLKAYQLWEERGHLIGFADVDWFDAEKMYTEELYALTAVDDLSNPEETEEVVGYSS